MSKRLGGDLPAGHCQPKVNVENPAVEWETDNLGACNVIRVEAKRG